MTEPDETLLLLGAYQDGELSPKETLDMERRLAAEPALRAMLQDLGGLSAALKVTLADVPVPDGLRDRSARTIGATTPYPPFPLRPRPEWRALAASLAIGFGLGGLFGGGAVLLGQRDATPSMAEAVLAGHLRGLAAPQPFDIASSDRHVVKPWFNGRTTIAPSAPDLADQGFPLIGGRIDIIDGHSVPTLVYRRDKHVISVTIVPRNGTIPAAEEHRDGSTLLAWTAGDLAYYVVSDLSTRDLRAFTDLFRQRL